MLKFAQLFNQKGVAPIVILIAVLLVGVIGGGFYYQTVYRPALIKETTAKIQTDYKELASSTTDLLDKLNADSTANDSKSMQKVADGLNEAANNVDKKVTSLSQSLSKKQGEAASYTTAVEAYLNKTKELLTFAKGGANITSKVADSMKELERLSKDIQSNSSDPASAKSAIKAGVEKLDKIIKDLEQTQVEKEYSGVKESYTALLVTTKDYFAALSGAIETSSGSAIATATSKYNTESTAITKKIADGAKDLEDKTKDLIDTMKKAEKEVNSKYDSLDSKFK